MIRTLDENDLDAFIRIRRDSLNQDPRLFGASPNAPIPREETRMQLKAHSKENFILGYFERRELVGMLGFVRHKNEKKRHKGYVWGVFVYDVHRGKGIGSKLLQECIDRVVALLKLRQFII
ncbi:MAG: GNAT family N-acetyltransferase [Bacteroidota bacterium]